jgi:hypothetical protein
MATAKGLLTIAIALVFVLVAVDSADAQRRRRRRQPTPPPAQVEAPVEAEAPAPEGAGPTPEGEAAPAQQVSPDADVASGQDATEEPEVAAEGAEGAEGADLGDEPFGPDLSPIRDAFTTLMDELVQVRNRVATLGRQLFDTRVQVDVQNRSSDDNTLARIVLTLDGAPIFRADSSEFTGEEGRQVFDGFAAPGPHTLTVEVEQRARADDNYRYTMRDTYRFQVVRGKLTEVEIVLDDDSDIAEDFADDGEGEYDVRTRLRVATRELR